MITLLLVLVLYTVVAGIVAGLFMIWGRYCNDPQQGMSFFYGVIWPVTFFLILFLTVTFVVSEIAVSGIRIRNVFKVTKRN